MGEGGEEEAEGVGIEQVGRATLGEQVQLVLFRAIFRIDPRAVELLVELLGGMRGGWQGSDRQARVVLAPPALRPRRGFGPGDHTWRRRDLFLRVRHQKERKRRDGWPVATAWDRERRIVGANRSCRRALRARPIT